MNTKKEQEIIHQVIAEAWTNPTFKQQLIENPISAIKALTGQDIVLPEGKTLQVFDQSDENIICLNIPTEPNLEDMELTPEQLEIVAGGGIIIPYIDLSAIFINTMTHPPQ
jgi:hypothetical protein